MGHDGTDLAGSSKDYLILQTGIEPKDVDVHCIHSGSCRLYIAGFLWGAFFIVETVVIKGFKEEEKCTFVTHMAFLCIFCSPSTRLA